MPNRDPLPIDASMGAIVGAIADGRNVVIGAAPGAGKTTRVPGAVLDHLLANGHGAARVLVLEPRRIAARLAAARVAVERKAKLGDEVGYHVRYDRKESDQTRLTFMTEGMALQRLAQDPVLKHVQAVVLDEVHERHVDTDVCLAVLRNLQQTKRPDLRLVAMSATLDTDRFGALLDATVVSSEGRQFPIDIQHDTEAKRDPLDVQVARAVRKTAKLTRGNLLVFLPGVAEIRRAMDRSRAAATDLGLDLMALHGRLSLEDQQHAIAPSKRQKVIFATNVAESSVTIAGVTAVIDSGLVREATVVMQGSRLKTVGISQASATQRAGRAGRTAPGFCIRLYDPTWLAQRPQFATPEIERTVLNSVALRTRAAGADPRGLTWLSPPADAAWDEADESLRRLGALGEQGSLSSLGKKLAGWPTPPQWAAFLTLAFEEAASSGDPALAWWAAVLCAIATENLRIARPDRTGGDTANIWQHADTLLEQITDRRLSRSARSAERVARQLMSRGRQRYRPPPLGEDAEAAVAAIGKLLVRCFPERLAKRTGRPTEAGAAGPKARSSSGARKTIDVSIASGGRLSLPSHGAPLGSDGFCVALNTMERDRGAPQITCCAPVHGDQILDVWLDEVDEQVDYLHHARRDRIEKRSIMRFRGLSLDETNTVAEAGPEATEALIDAALAAGHGAVTASWLDGLRGPWQLVASLDDKFPPINEALVARLIKQTAPDVASLTELLGALPHVARHALTESERKKLRAWAPTELRLQNGNRLKVTYDLAANTPTLRSYIQDFFGEPSTPKLAGGKLTPVVHLWAPNKRDVQVTSDLASFWKHHYPDLRRSLCRRYPRHHFPEDPLTAKAVRLKRHL